ncbi:MAG: diaminopimelate epimerase, partial [Clostridia bacterium]|nr:diaminopimelate epimerase [Clostridia bacterium]
MRFFKMNGLGNDYIFITETDYNKCHPLTRIDRLCDRHIGIGGDGVVLYGKTKDGTLTMKIFNRDGSEAEMCGNALRCLIKHEDKPGKMISVITRAGLKTGTFDGEQITVNIGKPVSYDTDLRNIVVNGNIYCGKKINVGNPHFVHFRPYDNETAKAISECKDFFPNRTNVEFVTVENEELYVRVYERGCGETTACGTGAAAALIASGKKE